MLKTFWWKVDICGVYNIYKINMLFKNYNGWSGIYVLFYVRYDSLDASFTNISTSN